MSIFWSEKSDWEYLTQNYDNKGSIIKFYQVKYFIIYHHQEKI